MTEASPAQTSPLQRYAPWLVALVAVAVYANSLQNGFALDDEGILVHNETVQHLSGFWRAFMSPYWPNGAGQFRPLVIASFTGEWALWQAHPLGYHAINMVWHTTASVLVYAFARRWLSFGGSTVAALLFAVHPVHVEAVSNVVGRSELMAACGILVTLLLHARRSPWAVLGFAVALFSKEHALLTPLLALGLDAFERVPSAKSREGREPMRAVWPLYAGYAGVAVAWAVAVVVIFHDRPFAAVDPFWATLDVRARWLTALGLVPVWLRLWFYPFDLSSDYSPRSVAAWPENLALALMGAALILLAGALMLLARRKSARPAAVAMLWMAVTMLPVANLLVPTGVIVAERTLYLSSIGAVMLAGFAVEWCARRRAALTLGVTVAIALAFAARTWTRTPVWQSNRALFIETVSSHPEASWTHVQLARIYYGNGGVQQALTEYRIALALFDKNPVSVAEAIYAAARAGEYALADSIIRRAEVQLSGDYLTAIAHANVALQQHHYSESVRAAGRAIEIAPDSAGARLVAGRAWIGLGAIDSARAAIARIPANHPHRAQADSLLQTVPPSR